MRVVCTFTLLGALSLSAQDIIFKNRTITFTNLQGTLYKDVTLIKADSDGLIWRQEASGGRVCFTNLAPEVLEALGIPTERIEIAKTRAENRAVVNAKRRAEEAIADEQARARAEAEAPVRARQAAAASLEAQRKSDLEKITALAAQIDAANDEIRRAEVVVHDANHANLHNDYAPTYYVKESARYKVEQAKKQLAKMRADFVAKYGANSDSK